MQLVPHPRDQDLVTIDRRAKATGLPTRTFQPDSCHRVSIPSQWIVVRNAWLRAGWRKCLIICGLRTGWEAGSPCRDPMKPLETLAVLHNVFGTSDLPSLGRFGCFRPFAPVFAFCWRNDTQNDPGRPHRGDERLEAAGRDRQVDEVAWRRSPNDRITRAGPQRSRLCGRPWRTQLIQNCAIHAHVEMS